VYLSLFISAFAAATILPAQSEALLAYQVSISPDAVVQLIAVATLGNVLGATFNWCLGRLTENLGPKNGFLLTKNSSKRQSDFMDDMVVTRCC
jgi:membrane protein YqaA with SNARE-associated domain